MACIMQIIVFFGSKRCMDTARLLGKKLYCSPSQPSQNISSICQHMRQMNIAGKEYTGGGYSSHAEQKEETSWIKAPPGAYELLSRCLELNCHQRITANQAINHSFLSEQ